MKDQTNKKTLTVAVKHEWLFDLLAAGEAKTIFVQQNTPEGQQCREAGPSETLEPAYTDFESITVILRPLGKLGAKQRKLELAHIRTDVVLHGYRADYPGGRSMKVQGNSYRLFVAPVKAAAVPAETTTPLPPASGGEGSETKTRKSK